LSTEEQFNTIYQQHYAKVFRLCKGYFNGDEMLAADATQEVFIKVWQHLERFRKEAAIGTWIYRITVNTCLLHLRKPSSRKEVKTVFLPEQAAEPYNPQPDVQLRKMYACIQQLDETGKMIILMVLEGIDYTAIAGVAGITEDTLRVKIHRIKKNLSNCVQHDSI
jgi:RNA polymerase sigma factor (sigma-70 family)